MTCCPAERTSGSRAGACLFLCVALLLAPALARAQQEFVITIETTLGDTTETFWLQIPPGYQPTEPRPLLVGWHQLGANHLEFKTATVFDSIAAARGWIAAAPGGSVPSHWTNHPTQSHVVDMIRWIEDRYAVDPHRIYMVGASMGGAAGMVFAANHLDPAGPMVAAAASISGIQDCERRFHEQGINNSMIAAFGGTPEEVPFQYHRNSAIMFADSTVSMHTNARHLPLYLTFGRGVSDSIWRAHAEDLYARLTPFADLVVLRESARNGHGWSCAEAEKICDFLGAHTLDPVPRRISIAADEDGRSYWCDLSVRPGADRFARLETTVDPEAAHVDVAMIRNVDSASLDLAPLGFPLSSCGVFTCRWEVLEPLAAELAFTGVTRNPATVLRDGIEYADWTYDPARQRLALHGSGSALYSIFFELAGVPDADGAGAVDPAVLIWRVPGLGLRYLAPAGREVHWTLHDIAGRKLGEDHAEAGGVIAIDSGRSSGIYFVTLSDRSGSRMIRKVLVVR